ncbi:hypothetical protein C5Y96_25050 [Blastopirellula marina]|uniref:Carboxypeptidase regulatory-like domain-containing protein n=1 Tax=Blastopirellula marina TaxID=124 RepID=A0A2S8EZ21_9BACT|nr:MULTISPECIES: carboxypeptidase-like regulatory domain-containing protein [Pirellulaceae]PQO25176.1 hypothetical protein C5Y96_25050 [Blastopirellula marina]RCS41609.1 carboxypeptidase regulatory-like domain-containing protein [Bremerella cremea]
MPFHLHAKILMLLLVSSFAMSLGCGSEVADDRPARAKVTGKVMLNGAPVENARIQFHAVNKSQGAIGQTTADGTFTVTTYVAGDGALPGDYVVTISKVEVQDGLSEDEKLKMQEMGRPVPPPKTKEHMPPQYTKSTASPLKVTVKAGEENHFDFDVKK